jgi:hypothetical protein
LYPIGPRLGFSRKWSGRKFRVTADGLSGRSHPLAKQVKKDPAGCGGFRLASLGGKSRPREER